MNCPPAAAGTLYGRPFDLFRPDPALIDPQDLAWGLARLARFNGMTTGDPLSVAQHSVMVSKLVPDQYVLHGLLHDCAECYLGDIVRPVKQQLEGNYAAFEATLEAAVAQRFGIEWTPEARAAVKAADRLALAAEVRDLRPDHAQDAGLGDVSHIAPIEPLAWEDAVELWWDRLNELWEDRDGGERAAV